MESDGGLTLSRRQLLAQAGLAAVTVALPPLAGAVKLEQPARTRVRENFDLGWKFSRGDFPAASQASFDDSGWRSLDLPHDWSIEGPFSADEKSEGSLPTGIGWYRKSFTLPNDTSAHRKWVIEFDGVYENSEVWINGHKLGVRPYGYVPFYYGLSGRLNLSGVNVIAVRVDNSKQPNCRWYSGSGIYRHVWLLQTEAVHVAPWGVFVTTPEVSKQSATVEVKTVVANDSDQWVTCTLLATLLDLDGKELQSTTMSQQIGAEADREFVQRFSVPSPILWSHELPAMYSVNCQVQVDGASTDLVNTRFGIRSAVFDAQQGFVLNGERVKLNGVCVHHDGGCVGAAVPERVWERRLEILRLMGCNAIRTSHNPVATEFLDMCDRMGFYVMAEAFDEWKVGKGQIGPYGYANYFDEWYEQDVRNFVRRDRNHPCIVIWSAGNEIGDQSAPNGTETLKKLMTVFHREDSTRLVTAGCDQIDSEPLKNRVKPEFLEALDVVGYNYVDRWRERAERYYEVDKTAHPGWKMIGTESPSIGGLRGDYSSLFPAPATPGRPGFGRRSSVDVEQLWKFVRMHDYVAGDFMWTGIDHLGESRWPAKGASPGVIDTCGFAKDGYYFYQSQWTSEPVLHMFPHWNWAGKEGQFIPVTCFTNCDKVELFINGRSVGEKGYMFPREGMEERWPNMPARSRVIRTTADLHLSWDVPYEPGTLKAVGTKDGKVVSTVLVSSTGEAAGIVLTPDRPWIKRGRGEVGHFEVRVVDANGLTVPTADNNITFEVLWQAAGSKVAIPGPLTWLDNGDPMSHEEYRANHRKAFHGMCLAIVAAPFEPGDVTVRASSLGLKSAEVVIKAGVV